MLENTFFHIPNFGVGGERHLWNQGCPDWNTFLDNPTQYDLAKITHETAVQEIERSKAALQNGNFEYFERVLGPLNAWRAWPHFREKCVYLDIETDGGFHGAAITMVGVYDGEEFECFIRDEKLNDFPSYIQDFSMIVTFFGTGFDLPMVRKRFPMLSMPQIHLDLCPTLKTLGYKGGLKKIEAQLGIARAEGLEDLRGNDAITLWRGYQRGNQASLKKLVAYNREDVVNLERLTEIAYNESKEKTLKGTKIQQLI